MNKEEFMKAVSNLRYNCNYGSSYDRSVGFDECKKQVMSLITELDIDGMSPRTFELFRNAMNDLTNNYEEMFELQKELQQARQEILFLQKQLIDNYERNKDDKQRKIGETTEE